MNIKKTIAITLLVLFVLSIVGQSVLADNNPPSIIFTPSQDVNSVKEGTTFTIDVEAFDKDGDKLEADIIGKPERAKFYEVSENKWQFKWDIDYNEATNSPYKVFIAVKDKKSRIEKLFYINVVDVNVPPTIKSFPLYTAEETQTLSFKLDGDDFDGDKLTYSLISTKVDRSEQDLNNHYNAMVTKDGNFIWTPTYEDGGNNYFATILVEDGKGGEATTTFEIEVFDKPVKPTITFLNGKEYTVEIGKEVKVRLEVVDLDKDLLGTYAKHKDSKGNYVEDTISSKYSHEDREFVWTTTSADEGTHYVKFFAYDMHNSVSEEVKITVKKATGTPADPTKPADPANPDNTQKNEYEKKYDKYNTDYEELEDDYYYNKKKYEVAISEKDQSDKDKYKKKLGQVDDDLKDLKDDINDLIDEVEKKDKNNKDLLEDLDNLKDDIGSLRDKISSVTGSSSSSTSSDNILKTSLNAPKSTQSNQGSEVEVEKLDFSNLINTAAVTDPVTESGFSTKMYLLIAGIVVLVIAIIFLLAILLI